MRLAFLVTALAVFVTAVPAVAQTPNPQATGGIGMKRVPTPTLQNPANRQNNPGTASVQACISGPTAMRSQNMVNPITGLPQAAPIIEIPVTKGGGSVASATTRAQQAQACVHGR
jgi:hypothetical protein